MLDWFGKMIGLPTKFMHHAEGSKGGGVIQVSNIKILKDYSILLFLRVVNDSPFFFTTNERKRNVFI